MLIIKKEGERIMKILCILYDDPKGGMSTSYPVKELPKLEKYPVISWVE